jgi:hypothetical protein
MEKINRKITRTTLENHFAHNQKSSHEISLARMTLSVCLLLITVALAACSSSASTPTQPPVAPATIAPQQNQVSPTSTPQPIATPTTAPVETSTSAPQQALVNTPLDPCQLLSSQEASALAGASFGPGKESTTSGGMKICTYGSQTTNVFTAEVAQAPDVATAKADQAQFLADMQANLKNFTDQGLNITQDPGFADGAVMSNITFSSGGITFNGNAMGFRKGLVFFGFSDLVLGGKAPTDTAMQSEANTVLGELP